MSIPQYTKASVALTRSEQFEGDIAASELPRLRTDLEAEGSSLHVLLQAWRNNGGDWLKGRIDGDLEMQCQRCLKPFVWQARLKLDLRLVHSEAEEARLLADYEPYRVEDDRLPLHEIVEDELLLALPMMPRCADCERLVAAADAEPTVQPKNSALAQLKNLTLKGGTPARRK